MVKFQIEIVIQDQIKSQDYDWKVAASLRSGIRLWRAGFNRVILLQLVQTKNSSSPVVLFLIGQSTWKSFLIGQHTWYSLTADSNQKYTNFH